MINSLIILTLIIIFFILGLIVGDKKIFPYYELKYIKYQITKKSEVEVFKDTTLKTEVNCDNLKEQKKLVFFTFGQSNSANHGSKKSKYKVKNNAINIFNKKCYIADDPLLDASGRNGSVWGRLADLIIENTEYEVVLIKSIGIGGLSVSNWSKKLLLNKIESSINEIKEMGFEIDIIFWHQGETDNLIKMKKNEYKEHFYKILTIIEKSNTHTPISLAIASYVNDVSSSEITKAQYELINENKNIYEGVNSDLITGYRDGVHFSQKGLDKLAEEWFNSLKKEKLITTNK